MFPTLSPHGASYVGEGGTEDNLDEFASLLFGEKENWSVQKVNDLLKHSKTKRLRLRSGELLDSHLRRKGLGNLSRKDQRDLLNRLPYQNHRGLRRAAEALFNAPCLTILKFKRVWAAIDTCLVLAFRTDNKETIDFKMKWWKIVAHDVSSSNSIHYACKKWGSFSLYLNLHFGGCIQPVAEWKNWYPALPQGTWLTKLPGTLTKEESAMCRILGDKRGLPAGDKITQELAMRAHREALTKGDTMSESDKVKLLEYSTIAAKQVKECLVKDVHWFSGKAGHVSLSNSACFENTRDLGGKRAYVLTCLKAWLLDEPSTTQLVRLPTGESYQETNGVPRWKTIRPPGMEPAKDLPSGIRVDTGLLTCDFADGESERVGFQLFCWAYSTLQSGGYLDQLGRSTGKPMPVARSALGEPGCKARIITKSIAAFIIYGQPFAHAMRELLEHHPGLKAGLGSGYQLHEWLKLLPGTIPRYVMIGDFESATDHIQHVAGRLAVRQLLSELGAPEGGYSKNFVDLLLSPRVIEENGEVIVTNSGCLMGEPGTKIVLTFLALVANCYAHRGAPSPLFATAGDDQIDAAEEPEVLLEYAEASRVTTMVPSTEKWGVFTFTALYCQQLLDIQNGSSRGAEIAVPKPRLLSPESKSNRGDDETNPAYGKSSQLAREISWSPFLSINQSMVVLFLRNMRHLIKLEPQAFLPREWGGLGLPGIPVEAVVPALPDWHQKLIAHREDKSPNNRSADARKVLANWCTTRIMHRGMLEPENLEINSLLEEFLPTATIEEIGPECPPETRYREKLTLAKKLGWIPLSDLLLAVKESTTYENIWDLRAVTDRGFSSISWATRSKRLKEISQRFPPLELVEVPEGPSWDPRKLVLVQEYYGISETPYADDDLEEGEIQQSIVPLMGTFASPRCFLHYDNNRLILHASSHQR
jgi:hypothetical protein